MRPSVLFISEQTLKDKTVISDNIEPKVLMQTIEAVQEERIQPALGSRMYARLVDGITASNLTANEEYLLNNYIHNAMKWFILAELPMVIGVKFYNRNILRKAGEGDEGLSMSDMYSMMDYYKKRGEFQLERLIAYLVQNATSTVFAEYYTPSSDVNNIGPDLQSYTCPFPISIERKKDNYQRPENYE